MVRGQADFGMYAPKADIASLSDMADLAVRLGSIVEYDRRGDVISLDNFESPVPRFKESSTGTSTHNLNSEYARSGAQSVKLLTEATANKYAGIDIYLSPLALGKHGVKISASLYEAYLYNSTFIVWVEISDGSNIIEAGIRLNVNQRTLEYWKAAGAWETFETNFYPKTIWEEVFHNIKLVVDFTAGEYMRLMIDTLTWDMSAYTCQVTATPEYVYAIITFQLLTLTDQALSHWIDDFIYTINEP